MSTKNSTKLVVLKNKQGQALRVLQSQSSQLNLVQNKSTKRLELLDSKVDLKKSYTLLQEISLEGEETVSLKNYGTLSIQQGFEYSELDPQLPQQEDTPLPVTMKWSSISHGAVLSVLVLFYLVMPQKKHQLIDTENLVTIQVDSPNQPKTPELMAPPPVEAQTTPPPSAAKKKAITVAPRVDKTKSLKVTHSGTSKNKNAKMVANSHLANRKGGTASSFQRLGTIGALNNALRGVRTGSGSGLRLKGQQYGSGGNGRGAGIGKGNGTMGHGNDKGGGYEQALYGKGLIAGQVGGGGGGFGSGWGNGTPGEGSYGTKGKGGGHEGYGTSRMGSGARSFSYPVTEEAMVEGGLDREAVILVVMKNIGQITYCYELGLQQKPQLRGRVLVDFVINGQGKVASQSIASSSLKSSQVENCMLSKIKTWKFPRPVGGVNVEVNYPFALQRVSGSSTNLTAK